MLRNSQNKLNVVFLINRLRSFFISLAESCAETDLCARSFPASSIVQKISYRSENSLQSRTVFLRTERRNPFTLTRSEIEPHVYLKQREEEKGQKEQLDLRDWEFSLELFFYISTIYESESETSSACIYELCTMGLCDEVIKSEEKRDTKKIVNYRL